MDIIKSLEELINEKLEDFKPEIDGDKIDEQIGEYLSNNPLDIDNIQGFEDEVEKVVERYDLSNNNNFRESVKDVLQTEIVSLVRSVLETDEETKRLVKGILKEALKEFLDKLIPTAEPVSES